MYIFFIQFTCMFLLENNLLIPINCFQIFLCVNSCGRILESDLVMTDLTKPYNHNKIFQECVMIVRLS
jgi:hypothetical protein